MAVEENKLVTYYDLDDKIVNIFNTFFDTNVFNTSNTAPGSEFCQEFFPNLYMSSDIGYKCLIKDDLQYNQLTYSDIVDRWVGNYSQNVVWKGNFYPCINVGSIDTVTLASLSSDIEYNQCITIKDIENLNFDNIDKHSFLLTEIICDCNVFAQFENELYYEQFIRWDFNYGGSRELSFPNLSPDELDYWLDSSTLERLGLEDTIFKIYGGYSLPCRFHFKKTVYEYMKLILKTSKKDIVYFDFENSEWVGSYECTFDLPDNKDTYVNIIYNNENHLICFKADDSAQIVDYESEDGQYNWRFRWLNPHGKGKLKITESFQEILNPAHMLVYQYDIYNMEIIIPREQEGEILFPFGGKNITLDIMPSGYEIGMNFIKIIGFSINGDKSVAEITVDITDTAPFEITVSGYYYLNARFGYDEREECSSPFSIKIPAGETTGSHFIDGDKLIGFHFNGWTEGYAEINYETIIRDNTYVYIAYQSTRYN